MTETQELKIESEEMIDEVKEDLLKYNPYDECEKILKEDKEFYKNACRPDNVTRLQLINFSRDEKGQIETNQSFDPKNFVSYDEHKKKQDEKIQKLYYNFFKKLNVILNIKGENFLNELLDTRKNDISDYELVCKILTVLEGLFDRLIKDKGHEMDVKKKIEEKITKQQKINEDRKKNGGYPKTMGWGLIQKVIENSKHKEILEPALEIGKVLRKCRNNLQHSTEFMNFSLEELITEMKREEKDEFAAYISSPVFSYLSQDISNEPIQEEDLVKNIKNVNKSMKEWNNNIKNYILDENWCDPSRIPQKNIDAIRNEYKRIDEIEKKRTKTLIQLHSFHLSEHNKDTHRSIRNRYKNYFAEICLLVFLCLKNDIKAFEELKKISADGYFRLAAYLEKAEHTYYAKMTSNELSRQFIKERCFIEVFKDWQSKKHLRLT